MLLKSSLHAPPPPRPAPPPQLISRSTTLPYFSPHRTRALMRSALPYLLPSPRSFLPPRLPAVPTSPSHSPTSPHSTPPAPRLLSATPLYHLHAYTPKPPSTHLTSCLLAASSKPPLFLCLAAASSPPRTPCGSHRATEPPSIPLSLSKSSDFHPFSILSISSSGTPDCSSSSLVLSSLPSINLSFTVEK